MTTNAISTVQAFMSQYSPNNNVKTDNKKGFDEAIGKSINKYKSSKSDKKNEYTDVNAEPVNKTFKSKDISKKTSAKEDDSIPDDEKVVAAAQNLVQQIVQFFKDDAGISEDDLNGYLKMLGVNAEQLLNPNIAKEILVLSSGNSNIIDSLTNEDFATNLQQLNQIFQDASENGTINLEDLFSENSEIINNIDLSKEIQKVYFNGNEANNIAAQPEEQVVQQVTQPEEQAVHQPTQAEGQETQAVQQPTQQEGQEVQQATQTEGHVVQQVTQPEEQEVQQITQTEEQNKNQITEQITQNNTQDGLKQTENMSEDNVVESKTSKHKLKKDISENDDANNFENAKSDDNIEDLSVGETQNSNQQQSGDTKSKFSDDAQMAAYETFINNLEKVTNVDTQNVTEEASKATQMREVVEQIVEQIKTNVNSDTTSLEMQLNPENLGKVNLSISSKGGEVSAKFIVENQVAKEAIESQLEVLKERFDLQGVRVNEVEVSIANYDFTRDFNQNSQSEYQGQRHQKKKSFISLEEINEKLEDNVRTETLKVNGSSVEYSA